MLKEIKSIYKVLMSTIIVIVTLILVSCDNNIPNTSQQSLSNHNIQKAQYNDDYINLESILLDCNTIELIHKQLVVIAEELETGKINQETAEAEFQNVLKSLIENGHKLRELLTLYYGDIEEDDITLAATVFCISAIYIADCEYFYESGGPNYAPSTEQIFNCLAAVVGYYVAKDLITSASMGLVTATTVLQVVKALAKRYAGYAGVAIMIYEFSKCIGYAVK